MQCSKLLQRDGTYTFLDESDLEPQDLSFCPLCLNSFLISFNSVLVELSLLQPPSTHYSGGPWRAAMASSNSAAASCRRIDNTMHVWAGSCRGGFDFTLLFEEAILQILPIALILMLVPFRIIQLSHKRRKVVGSWLLLLKLVSSFAFLSISPVR